MPPKKTFENLNPSIKVLSKERALDWFESIFDEKTKEKILKLYGRNFNSIMTNMQTIINQTEKSKRQPEYLKQKIEEFFNS